MTGDIRLAPIGFHYFCRGMIHGVGVSGRKLRVWECKAIRGADYALMQRTNAEFFAEWLMAGIRSGDLDDIDCGAPR